MHAVLEGPSPLQSLVARSGCLPPAGKGRCSARGCFPAAAAAGARVAGEPLRAGKARGASPARIGPLARVLPQVGLDALLGREARLAHGAVVAALPRVRHLVPPHAVPVWGRVRAPAALPHARRRQLAPAGRRHCWKPTTGTPRWVRKCIGPMLSVLSTAFH